MIPGENEYSWFVDTVLTNKKKTDSLEKAIDITLDQMDKDALIRPFLINNKAEVKSMFLTEYNEARVQAELRADGYEDGFDDGREEGRDEAIRNTALNMLAVGIPFEIISQCTGLSLNAITELKESSVNET